MPNFACRFLYTHHTVSADTSSSLAILLDRVAFFLCYFALLWANRTRIAALHHLPCRCQFKGIGGRRSLRFAAVVENELVIKNLDDGDLQEVWTNCREVGI